MTDPRKSDPPCRWRRKETEDGLYGCASPKLIVKKGVRLDFCAKCYCRDHEPAPWKGVGDVMAAAFRRLSLNGNGPKCGCRERKAFLNRWLGWK